MYFRVAIIIAAMSLSACSSWVFRYDVPQGNYLDKKSINKLQVGMTKEQVKFILGSPVIVDTFDNDTWNYVYRLKSGKSKKFDRQRKLVINFENDKVVSASGDYKLSENFNTPFDIDVVQASDLIGNSENGEGLVEDDANNDIQPIATEDEVEKSAKEAIKEAGLEAEDAP